MENNLRCIVTGLKRYSFVDRETSKQVEGTKVHFLQMVKADDTDQYGFVPAVTTMPYEYFEKFRKYDLPQICDAILTVSLTGNKPLVKVSTFIPLEPHALPL